LAPHVHIEEFKATLTSVTFCSFAFSLLFSGREPVCYEYGSVVFSLPLLPPSIGRKACCSRWSW